MFITVFALGLTIDDSTAIGFGRDTDDAAARSQASTERVFMRYEGDIDVAVLAAHLQSPDAVARTVYGPTEALDALNAALAPELAARLGFVPVEVGDTVALPDGMATALPADRGDMPAIGWLVEGPWRALAVSGDDGRCAPFWHWAANAPSLTDVVCPHITSDALALLPPNVHIWLPSLTTPPDRLPGFSHPVAAIVAGMNLEL